MAFKCNITPLVLYTFLLIGLGVMVNSSTIEELEKRLKMLETEIAQYDGTSPCGEWKPHKDEKCIKVFDKLPLQTYDDAIKTCDEQSKGSTLLSVHSNEEMEFITEFIFKTNKIVDNVWIGAKRKNSNPKEFEWSDGSEFKYTNWGNGRPTNNTQLNCVQLHTDSAFFEKSETGKWTDIQCNRKNLVVCEKIQKWSFERLQNKFLETRKSFIDSHKNQGIEIENLQKKLLETQKHLTDSHENTKREIENLRNNPIPIGFLYAQLSGESDPKQIWPMVEWEDVSYNYAGLFFRVNGGESSQFGTIQGESSPRLTHVDTHHGCDIPSPGGNRIPVNGQESLHFYSGGASGDDRSLSFTISNSEVRPRNMPMKIWKRIK